MKLKHLALGAALALPMMAMAIPATPNPIKQVNPDGTIVEIRLHGDEFFSYVTDLSNSVILEQNADGYWHEAIRDGRVLEANPASIALLRNEQDAHRVSLNLPTRESVGMHRMAPLDKEGRTTFPTIADKAHGLVVLVQYADTKFRIENPVEAFTKKLNEEGYSEYNSIGSARDYYIRASFGQFRPVFDVCPTIVTLPKNSAYYVGRDKYENWSEAMIYAVNYLFDQGFDFSKYDFDEDGKIDSIFFYYAGFGQADSGDRTTIWPHQGYVSGGPIQLGLVAFDAYACANELKGGGGYVQPYLDGIGTFVHEFGHVIGLPDMYDVYTNNTETPGNYDVMDAGSYNRESTSPPTFSSYERWLCRWLEYTELDKAQDIELIDLQDSNKAYRINVCDWDGMPFEDEYFLIESRTGKEWDAPMSDQGLAMWHIRYARQAWATNMVNYNGTARYRLIRPSKEVYNGFWGGNDDHLIPGDEQYFTPKDYRAYNFSPAILDIKLDRDNNRCTFTYTPKLEGQSDQAPKITSTTVESDFRNLHIQWTPVEGAEDYLLTVYKTNVNGSTSYVKQCRELSTGSAETEYVLQSLTSNDWKSQLFITVRAVVNGYPSSKASAPYVCVPQTCNEWSSGIEDIFADDNAPVEYYTLQGVKVAEPQYGQLYICRRGAKSYKVIY